MMGISLGVKKRLLVSEFAVRFKLQMKSKQPGLSSQSSYKQVKYDITFDSERKILEDFVSQLTESG